MALAVSGSLVGVASGYAGHRAFAWQMFPEASRWHADIVRVTTDGERVNIAEPWPGDYRWSELVTESGLSRPHVDGNAAYGAATTLGALQHALDWVAAHTSNDNETLYLEAEVHYRYNADPPLTVTLRSASRHLP